jgi:hypothetical protein
MLSRMIAPMGGQALALAPTRTLANGMAPAVGAPITGQFQSLGASQPSMLKSLLHKALSHPLKTAGILGIASLFLPFLLPVALGVAAYGLFKKPLNGLLKPMGINIA